jgi:undecaprenyl-diphosphatase
MDAILQLDESLFHAINSLGQNTFFDWLMPIWRNKLRWIPLYLILVSVIIYQLKIKGLYLLLALGLTIGIADTMSSKVIKKTVKRERPCRNTNLPEVRNLVHCGGGYSFTSSHATNHFAVAAFLIFLTGGIFGKWRYLLWIWAAIVAYAQVYVGVHYPFDVICGGILGILIAYFTSTMYKKVSPKI